MLYFCMSDLHGSYPAMEYAIEQSGYDSENPNHQLVSLGDEFGRSNRGLGSKGIYEYLTSDRFFNKPIVIRGNHQDILLNIFKKNEIDYIDILNGEDKTIASLSQMPSDYIYIFGPEEMLKAAAKTGVKEWIKHNPFYLKTKNHYLFHGWCPDRNGKIDPHPEKVSEKRWVSASWADTKEKIYKFKELYPDGYDKTLVFGHWGTHRLREEWPDGRNRNQIWVDKQHKLVGIDQTTYHNPYIDMYIFEDDPE